jgi:uncharacterized protein YjbJ (UPF0337 family)
VNWDQIAGKWTEMKGHLREKWGELTDDELDQMKGKRDQLAGIIQQKYGLAKEETERQIKEFEASCKC